MVTDFKEDREANLNINKYQVTLPGAECDAWCFWAIIFLHKIFECILIFFPSSVSKPKVFVMFRLYLQELCFKI